MSVSDAKRSEIMTEKEFREFRDDVKERLVRLESEVSYNRRAIDENRLRIDENHRGIQTVNVKVQEVQLAVEEIRADVRVILTKLDEREKHQKRNLTVWGVVIAGTSALVSAVVSFFSTRP